MEIFAWNIHLASAVEAPVKKKHVKNVLTALSILLLKQSQIYERHE